MAYIYKITNDINDKVYIGKTEFDVNKRFLEHCRDSGKDELQNRPLYKAMRKYGVSHFHISIVEETDDPNNREVFWIEYYQSYHFGYNATFGGDGKRFLDYNRIISTYLETNNLAETARRCSVHNDSVRNILRANNISITPSSEVNQALSMPIAMFDKKDTLIAQFESIAQAVYFLIKNGYTESKNVNGISSHIVHVCKNKRKSAYGYIFKYL